MYYRGENYQVYHLYHILTYGCVGVSLNDVLRGIFRGVFHGCVSCLSPQEERGCFLGYVLPKSNFPALLEVEHAKQVHCKHM